MAYNWTSGEIITAEKLNQTGGSGENSDWFETVEFTFTTTQSGESATCNKSWNDLYALVRSGNQKIIIIKYVSIYGDSDPNTEYYICDRAQSSYDTSPFIVLDVYQKTFTSSSGMINIRSFKVREDGSVEAEHHSFEVQGTYN